MWLFFKPKNRFLAFFEGPWPFFWKSASQTVFWLFSFLVSFHSNKIQNLWPFQKKIRACGARIKYLVFQIVHTTEYMNAGIKHSHFVLQVAQLCTKGSLLIPVLYIPRKNYLFTVAFFGFFFVADLGFWPRQNLATLIHGKSRVVLFSRFL